jgi:hypothetical protein
MQAAVPNFPAADIYSHLGSPSPSNHVSIKVSLPALACAGASRAASKREVCYANQLSPGIDKFSDGALEDFVTWDMVRREVLSWGLASNIQPVPSPCIKGVCHPLIPRTHPALLPHSGSPAMTDDPIAF